MQHHFRLLGISLLFTALVVLMTFPAYGAGTVDGTGAALDPNAPVQVPLPINGQPITQPGEVDNGRKIREDPVRIVSAPLMRTIKDMQPVFENG